MAGRIPQAFIDELLTRTDIVDIIDSRVQLKKAGRDFKACCPFHNEKTPSFTVSQVKQFYHCFGCGEHGTAISFLMNYEHMEFIDAVEELAQRAGLEVPREAGIDHPHNAQSRPLHELLEKVADWYREQLRMHAQKERAVEYLKQRGLTGEVAARFGIGFAPPGWENLAAGIGADSQAQQQLQELGLTVQRDGKPGSYDRFRDRIMFPIRDRRGRTIAFGGRVLGDDTPKYMNSPESAVFHKGRELYGLFEARKAERRLERILVVEGYMDVVALAQFGVNNAVATLGTATTPEHLERLYRTVPEVVFCFDGDRAGREAAWRALDNALPVLKDGREARFLFLPDGEDPDTLVRKTGAEDFVARTRTATHLSDVFFERLSANLDLGSIDGRARLVNDARPLLARLPDGMFHRLMVERLAELAHTAADGLAESTTPDEPVTRTHKSGATAAGNKSAVRCAMEILLYQPSLANDISEPDLLKQCDLPGVPLLVALLEQIHSQPGLHTAALLEHWRDQADGPVLERLAQWSPAVEDADLLPELQGYLNSIQRQYIDNRIHFLEEAHASRKLTEAESREYWELQQQSHAARRGIEH